MKVVRKMEIETGSFQVGDTIGLNEGYTATCQKLTGRGALFLFDQYVAKMPMNMRQTNEGGWRGSYLRQYLLYTTGQYIPLGLLLRLGTFESGDKFRIPMVAEMADDAPEWIEYKASVWAPMVDRRNRIAFLKRNSWEWCWCMDRDVDSATRFCYIGSYGYVGNDDATLTRGVRPVFLLKEDKYATNKSTD